MALQNPPKTIFQRCKEFFFTIDWREVVVQGIMFFFAMGIALAVGFSFIEHERKKQAFCVEYPDVCRAQEVFPRSPIVMPEGKE